jgi:alkanesulfonate monooxygenase SsuD/methylene tetrahydromethanopterin reductase-like flavin-dependent oxidoreductase (luciferase family)
LKRRLSGRQCVIDRAKRDNLTVRQLAQIARGDDGLSFTGTAKTIAGQMEEWLLTDACGGFNVMFP